VTRWTIAWAVAAAILLPPVPTLSLDQQQYEALKERCARAAYQAACAHVSRHIVVEPNALEPPEPWSEKWWKGTLSALCASVPEPCQPPAWVGPPPPCPSCTVEAPTPPQADPYSELEAGPH